MRRPDGSPELPACAVPHGGGPTPGRPLRILIVEDETLLSLELETQLEEWGHAVVGAESTGAAAIRTALAARPDLVLMDINLGSGIDGIAAATAIRDSCAARVVFMTAYAEHDIASRLEGFAAEVLHKPFNPERLQRILVEAANRPG